MKRIVFLTGTRADFGKLKSLIRIAQRSDGFDVHIFATGMHMNSKFGKTVNEILKSGFENVHGFINHDNVGHMDRTLAKTVDGFSHYVAEMQPDLIVVHGDRAEALAGAIVGSLNNILVAHVEGGEISGTIDELIRHSVSKLAHIHLVSNNDAARRLVQMGERPGSIHVIGSPDLDVMFSEDLPSLESVLAHYEIPFDDFALGILHPVTTEANATPQYAADYVDALIESGRHYVIIHPNNDPGSDAILSEYQRLRGHERFRLFPSIRFEAFIVLLKAARLIVGNSSAGIREAPEFGIPTVDIGTRQLNRAHLPTILHCAPQRRAILEAMEAAARIRQSGGSIHPRRHFGTGQSDQAFHALLRNETFWQTPVQKQFQSVA